MKYELANMLYRNATSNACYYAEQLKICKQKDIDWLVDELKYWRQEAEYYERIMLEIG